MSGRRPIPMTRHTRDRIDHHATGRTHPTFLVGSAIPFTTAPPQPAGAA
jgi:hypothetical protein